MTRNLAIATLLYSPDYLPGVFTLAYQLSKLLRESGNPNGIKTCLLVTKDLYNDILTSLAKVVLDSLFDEVVQIDHLDQSDAIIANNTENLELLRRPELNYTLVKTRLWEQTQYDQILYLDADTLPVSTQLFDVYYTFCYQNRLQIGAAPDIGWPDMFNSGVMVLIPDKEIASQLQKFTLQHVSIDGADQGILNQFFNQNCQLEDQLKSNRQWITLSFLYNVTTPNNGYQCPPAMKYFEDKIRLVHFIGKTKPWKAWTRRDFQHNKYTRLWFDIYNEFQAEHKALNQLSDLSIKNRNEDNTHCLEKEFNELVNPECITVIQKDIENEDDDVRLVNIDDGPQATSKNVDEQVEESEIPQVVLPLDFKEWLTTFIDDGHEQQQYSHVNEDEEEETISESDEEDPWVERVPIEQEQEQKCPQYTQYGQEQHQEQHPEQHPEQDQVDEQEREQEQDQQPGNELTKPEIPHEEQSHGTFQFDWETSAYRENVERVFPSIFEYEVQEDELEEPATDSDFESLEEELDDPYYIEDEEEDCPSSDEEDSI